MKEILITFNTAKLAKEKGFKGIETDNVYYDPNEEPINRLLLTGTATRYKGNNWFIYNAPTQSLLQKWLREKHNIDVVILPERYKDGINYLVQAQKWDLTTNEKSNPNFVVKASYWFNDNNEYPSFEEALEKGLQEALKLL